jgi:thiosulfate/3-mercaptopyruvate sulfurtransferase
MSTQGYAQPDLLVETDWLAARLDDPSLRIVDCDPLDVYRRAHIKNAIGIPVHHYIKQSEYTTDPRKHPLVAPPHTMQNVMERMGIGDDNLVVAYDSNGCLWAARLWWVLNYYGHTNVKVLNGGWKKWFDEGRPLSIDRPTLSSVTFTPRANPDMLCTLDYGKANVDNADVLFLDVRSDGEWEGTNDRGNKRAGRIPGAVHLEWLNFVTSDRYRTIKPAHELRAMLERVGATPDKEIVTY